MINKFISFWQRQGRSGQSLVETALFLPIIILLLAGAVEVSNLLVTQNRVTTASRVGTGFAAANIRGEDWLSLDPLAGWPAQVAAVARNNVTETLDLDPARWDIYTVKARLSRNGDFDPATGGAWSSYHAWGDEQTYSQAAWNGAEARIKQDIIAALDDTSIVPSEGLELVATVAYHDRNSILGLNAYNLGAFTRVRGLTVMRVDEPVPFVGCPLIPIGVRYDQFSMYPSNWPTGDPVIRYLYNLDGSPMYPEDPVDEVQIFPNPNQMTFPDDGSLRYVNEATAPVLNAATFVNNVPGVPLGHARPGYLYRARASNNLETPGGFGWFTWDGDTSAGALWDSIDPPGNFMDKYPGSNADLVHGNGNGFLEPGEWVENSTGNIASAQDLVTEYYVRRQMTGTLVVYDEYLGTGSGGLYRVAGFVKVKLLAYSFGGNDKWILFEFLGWADACRRPTGPY
jgi:hypothetical protein